METEIVVTGIVKSGDEFLVVKRSENDIKYPGVWEFPGGHVEDGETIKEALERELSEEIGFKNSLIEFFIVNYTDKISYKNEKPVHFLELDFIINADKNKLEIVLSEEHTEYKWVLKNSDLLDDYIKSKLENVEIVL